MRTKLVTIIATATIASLLFAVYQPTSAVQYYGHDGSVDKYLTKAVVKPYSNKNGLWTYIVKACATDHTLAVGAIILKSDIGEEILGVNKNIKKGDCKSFGAVMKAKNSNTLGAEMIEKHEGLEKYQEIVKTIHQMSKSDKKNAYKELYLYRSILGGLV